MHRSLGLRLTLAVVAVGVGTAALIAVAVNLAFGARFSSYVSAQQQARQSEVVTALAASYRAQGRWDASALGFVDPLAAMAGEQVSVFGAHGQLVWSSSSGTGGAMAAMGQAMMRTAPLGPAVRVPVVVAGARVGTAVIRLPAAGPSPLDQSFRASVERLLLFSGIGAALLAALVGILLARRVTAPVRSLTAAARALAGGQRAARLSEDAPDELGQMAAAFNTMADAVEAEDALRCGFARDVAHELRTPLTVLQSQVEALQDGLAQPGPETLASLHEETLRLARLVADLETLASADGAPFSVERETVALAPLVEAAIAELSAAMQERRVSVETAISEVTVFGDPLRLRQVAVNLLSNAAKFVHPGGHVRVGLVAEGTWVRLVVADDGPGIAPEDLPHVFERFFRGKDTQVGGSGIGLAVVAGLVSAHGGEVAVASEPGHGTTFTIRLPKEVQTAPRALAGRAPALPTANAAREHCHGVSASSAIRSVDGATGRRTHSG
jgi:signal transduction histidine kinase